jgi:alpha-D-ribose 1-methylphosphonate 5-triphosphate diphosphatase
VLGAISNATVVTPHGVVEGGTVLLDEGRVSGIVRRAPRVRGSKLDAAGRYVLPGLVDLHSDALETQTAPRTGAEIPPTLAFLEMDRYFASSGVTTGFHAIALVEGLGRTVAKGREHYGLVIRYRDGGLVRHELHLRCEVAQVNALEAVESLLPDHQTGIVSLMDHTPGQAQLSNLEWYKEHRGVDEAQMAVLQEAKVSGTSVLDHVRRVSWAAGEHNAILASHDDDTRERVESLAREGVRISEFPVNVEAARRAKELGLAVCVGAPNVVRGRSVNGNLSATAAVAFGLVDTLVSDYHPPSMLKAAFKLARDGVLPLHKAVDLISSGPARAAGLLDRGEVRQGAVADLLVIGERLGLPNVTHTIVGGRIVFAAEGPPGCPRDTNEAV